MSSGSKLYWANFIDWMSLLPFNLMMKISSNPEASVQINKAFQQRGK